MRTPIVTLLGVALTACASVPKFDTARPISSTHSLGEALQLCDEYQPPFPAERPVAIRPFLDCLDRSLSLHPPRELSPVSVFQAELHAVWNGQTEADWTPTHGETIARAIHASLRALWREEQGSAAPPVTPAEKKSVQDLFPRTAKELSADQWKVSNAAALDPRLEALRSKVSAWKRAGSAPRLAAEDATRVSGLCRDARALAQETEYLGSLWQDQYDMTQMSPESSQSQAARERYSRKLQSAEARAGDLESRLRDEKVRSGFDPGSCGP